MDFTGLGAMNNLPGPESTASMESRIRQLQQAAPKTKKEKELMAAAKDMESFFLYMLLKEMRKTVPESKLIHGGRGEEVFRDMMDEEMSKQISNSPGQSGLGIADMLYQQLSRPLIIDRINAEDEAAATAGLQQQAPATEKDSNGAAETE